MLLGHMLLVQNAQHKVVILRWCLSVRPSECLVHRRGLNPRPVRSCYAARGHIFKLSLPSLLLQSLLRQVHRPFLFKCSGFSPFLKVIQSLLTSSSSSSRYAYASFLCIYFKIAQKLRRLGTPLIAIFTREPENSPG